LPSATIGRALIAFLQPSLLMLGCGRDQTPHEAAKDSLALPPTWQVAKTVVKGRFIALRQRWGCLLPFYMAALPKDGGLMRRSLPRQAGFF
jgi:hypothetical protein